MGSSNSKARVWLARLDADKGFSEDECKAIWAKYDKNKNNVLERKEAEKFFQEYCKAKGISPLKTAVDRMFSAFDTNRNGQLEWDEVCKPVQNIAARSRARSSSLVKVATPTKPVTSSTPTSAPSTPSPAPAAPATPAAPAAEVKVAGSVDSVFDNYCGDGDEKDAMFGEKLIAFFRDHKQNEHNAVITLGFSYKIKAANPGEISRKEFTTGLAALGCNDAAGITAALERISKELAVDSNFQNFYYWMFNFMLDPEKGKSLDSNDCLEYWYSVLHNRGGELLTHFLDFFKSHNTKQVNFDMWRSVWDFIKDAKQDLSNWDAMDNGAWPAVIDDFVASRK